MWFVPPIKISGYAPDVMCFVKYLTATFSVGLSAKINNPLPATQYECISFVSLNALASKAATSAVIVGHSSKDLENFIDRTFRASISSCSALRNLIKVFPFFPRNNVRWGLTIG